MNLQKIIKVLTKIVQHDSDGARVLKAGIIKVDIHYDNHTVVTLRDKSTKDTLENKNDNSNNI